MRETLLLTMLVIAGSVPAAAQQPVDSLADLGIRVTSGDSLRVTVADGTRTGGAFANVSSSTLRLWVGRQVLEIPFTDIREVARRGDSLRNGFLIGAGIGAFLGGTVAIGGGVDVLAVPVNALLIGGVGVLIDHVVKGHTVVYRIRSAALRLEPRVSVARRGVSLSMSLSTR